MLTIPTIILYLLYGHTIEDHKVISPNTGQEIHCSGNTCKLTTTCLMDSTTLGEVTTFYLESNSPCAQFWGYGQ